MGGLSDTSVVVTGASSGIGRATALAFAREGAKLTLCAREASGLDRVVRECRRLGGQAQAYAADTSVAGQMRNLAAAAARRYGTIDIWVNVAGVGAVGRFTETPADAHEQVIRTNLIGYLNGAHAVLPMFLGRHRGTLINVLSFGSFVPAPFAASYSASKFGLRGLSEGLRAELQKEPDIHVCDVFPGFVDTPGAQHAGNYTGHALRPRAPDKAEDVAKAIVDLAYRPRAKTSVGLIASLAPVGYAVAPKLARWTMFRALGVATQTTPKARRSGGNVFRGRADRTGDDAPVTRRSERKRGGFGATALRAVMATALVVAVGRIKV